jgi:hypothetical protein
MGNKKGYTTYLAVAHKALLLGPNATSLAHAEGLIESLVWHWVRNIKDLKNHLIMSTVGN